CSWTRCCCLVLSGRGTSPCHCERSGPKAAAGQPIHRLKLDCEPPPAARNDDVKGRYAPCGAGPEKRLPALGIAEPRTGRITAGPLGASGRSTLPVSSRTLISSPVSVS